jgi:hypothetical protein
VGGPHGPDGSRPWAAPTSWAQLLEWLHRYRYALAPLSFSAGLASFLLIERREWLAQWISAMLILGWILILAEDAAARRLRLSPGLLRFGIQAIQQETFFFALPFFLHTTTWGTGQAVFTGAALLAGLCSMWDPLYFGRIAKRPWLYLAFHALAVFIGALTVAPILLHLTTTQTLALASASVAVLAVPSLAHVIERQRPLHWAMLVGGAVALGALSWAIRPWVPPATLWVQEAIVTDLVDAAQRRPNVALVSVSPAQLHAQGLYAFISIRAPRGLREQVWHRWLQDGHEVDRIALTIVGGRAEGYRAWSYKRGFPADPRGTWTVEAITDGGQLIGRIGFEVVGPRGGAAAPPRQEKVVLPGSEQPADDPALAEDREGAGDQQPADESADHEAAVQPHVPAADGEEADGDAEQGPERQQVDP